MNYVTDVDILYLCILDIIGSDIFVISQGIICNCSCFLLCFAPVRIKVACLPAILSVKTHSLLILVRESSDLHDKALQFARPFTLSPCDVYVLSDV